jgi:hypothetical protein
MTGFSPKGVLTVDIIDFSLMKNQEQLGAILKLIEFLQSAVPEKENHPSRRVWSPAGDGGSMTFEDIYAALETAKTLAKLINRHNQTHSPDSPSFQVRIGLHSGTVTKEVDFDNRENIWGEGINISARVAGLAKPGQILASQEFCERTDLLSMSPPDVEYIGKWWVKHNKFLPIYNLHLDGTGIPPSEVDIWFGPFYYPIQQAIETYEAMMEEELRNGRPDERFRVAVLCKRLMDLQPDHPRAKEVLMSFSVLRHAKHSGAQNLYHFFLSPMSPRAIRYFFENGNFQDFKKGATVVEEGKLADSMMVVVSGEIIPYIHGNAIPAIPEEKHEAGTERKALMFHEGDITGEMGLFSEGQKRTATLVASKNTTTLTLNYNFLKLTAYEPASATTFTPDDYIKQEIRNQIWGLHCKRIVQNQINSHPLLQKLPGEAQMMLNDYGEFLPDKHNQPITLAKLDVLAYWTFVVTGNVIAHTSANKQVTYSPGDCMGPLRLAIPDPRKPPFSKIEVTPNTQLVRFPWSFIKELLEGSNPPEDFFKAAKAIGERDLVYLS